MKVSTERCSFTPSLQPSTARRDGRLPVCVDVESLQLRYYRNASAAPLQSEMLHNKLYISVNLRDFTLY